MLQVAFLLEYNNFFFNTDSHFYHLVSFLIVVLEARVLQQNAVKTKLATEVEVIPSKAQSITEK